MSSSTQASTRTHKFQKVVLVGIFLVAVGGVTFVRNNWMSQTGDESGDAPALAESKTASAETRIDVPVPVVEYAPEFELHKVGHYDFWFKNPNPFPVELGLQEMSCKCSNVAVLALDPEEDKKLRRLLPIAAAGETLAGCSGLLHQLSLANLRLHETAFLADSSRWQKIEVPVKGVERPPARVPGQQTGMVRIEWDGRQYGPVRLTARVWAQTQDKPRTRSEPMRLEVLLSIAHGLKFSPTSLTVPDLGPNSEYLGHFYCWSSTRAGFSIAAHERTNDPNFECLVTPLTGDEFRAAAADESGAKDRDYATALTIYRVTVKVRERSRDGKQMDLGPFHRDIIVSTDQPDYPDGAVEIQGAVRGEFFVGTADDKYRDQVVLRAFRADRGTSATVPIETNLSGMKLVRESVTPSYLETKLEEQPEPDGGGRWLLTVTVPPNRVTGSLPADSAIVLKTLNQPPRRIRIPVVGKATMALGAR
jgi:hypothetical protein